MKLSKLREACHGEWLNQKTEIEINHVSKDTRTIEEGDLYIPIVGETFDGHAFINQAYEKGACASLTSRKDITTDCPLIYVKDTVEALADMARNVIEEANVPVVAITGSVGKTTTRDMVSTTVAGKYKTLRTEGNYNNEIGLPLTILRYTDEEAIVLEMGMNHAGEISHLSRTACPDVAIITNVGTAHIGNLGSRENILKAKLEIIDGLKSGGTLIINNDNDLLHAWAEKMKNVEHDYRIITVGIENESDFMAEDVEVKITGCSFTCKGETYCVKGAGIHYVYNALSSIATGYCLDIEPASIKASLAGFEMTKNRMDIYPLKDHISLIDATYNASLDSMKSSLKVLALAEHRKIAILADMLELGEYSHELHYETGVAADENRIDVLVCVGEESKAIIEGAKNTPWKYHFDTNEEVITFMKGFMKENDTILLKGSNGMRLKEVSNALKEFGKE